MVSNDLEVEGVPFLDADPDAPRRAFPGGSGWESTGSISIQDGTLCFELGVNKGCRPACYRCGYELFLTLFTSCESTAGWFFVRCKQCVFHSER